MTNDPGTLYIVSTPIGNLEDITLRAIRTLKEVSLIAAEDTRRTRVLLNAYDINTAMTSFYSYNVKKKTPGLVKKLKEGMNVALVSDSGTPGISDPGYVLIKECTEQGIPLTGIPGPTAFVDALILSGKTTGKFIFEGFLSNKGARRKKQLEALLSEDRTVVLYESPHRIEKMMKDLDSLVPGREIVVIRELTKKFEEIKRGKPAELLVDFLEHKPKGEFVVVF